GRGLAHPGRFEARGVDAFVLDEVVADGGGATLGELLVRVGAAGVVRVALDAEAEVAVLLERAGDLLQRGGGFRLDRGAAGIEEDALRDEAAICHEPVVHHLAAAGGYADVV